jgi:hypothetical protein
MNKKYTRRKPLSNCTEHTSVKIPSEMLIDLKHIGKLLEHTTLSQTMRLMMQDGIDKYYLTRHRDGEQVVMPSYMQVVEQDSGLLAGLNEEIK